MIRKFARPYAKAMMELSGTPEEAKRLHGELLSFERARASSRELQDLFRNPGVKADKKLAIVREMAKRTGASDLGVRLLEVLVTNQRINDLEAVLEGWKEAIDAALGVAVARVRTAHPLEPGESAALQAALEKRLGQTVEMELETDPGLLGGFVARVGSEVWDASVRGRVNKFRESLT